MRLIKNYCRKKTVQYFGLEIQVPEDTIYIATDEDGVVMAFEALPQEFFGDWLCIKNSHGKSNNVMVARVDLEGFDWRQTVVNVSTVPFSLSKAMKGHYVKLRDGRKAKMSQNDKEIFITAERGETYTINEDGYYVRDDREHPNDVLYMWENIDDTDDTTLS